MITSCGRFSTEVHLHNDCRPQPDLLAWSLPSWTRSLFSATKTSSGTRATLSSLSQQCLEPSPSGLPTSDPSRSAKSPQSILWKHPAPQSLLSSVVSIRVLLISIRRMMSSCLFRAVPQTQQGYTLLFASWPHSTRSWLRGEHR